MADAFNQPLSFDTSSVTSMQRMFEVRSARARPSASTVGPLPARCLHRQRFYTPSRLPARMSPSSHASRPASQGTYGLSDANKLLIRCAWSGSYAFDGSYGGQWSYLGACSPPPPLPPLPPSSPPYPPDAAPRPPPSPPPPYAFADTASLWTAVAAYNADPASATATYGPISSWNVSAVTSMNHLFSGMYDFNADISSWDTSSVTDMASMFSVRSARALRSVLTVGAFLHAACTAAASPRPPATRPAPHPSVLSLFTRQGASAFNQPLSFDTSSVTYMLDMFMVRSARALP